MTELRKLGLICARGLTAALVLGWVGTSSAATIVSARNSSDPRARVFDGKLYLYTSSDLNQSGSWPMNKTYGYSLTDANAEPGLASSWSDNGVLLNESDFAWSMMANHLWAPDAFQGKDGKFYLYVPDTLKTGGGSRVGVTVSSAPTGPFAPPSGFTTSNNYLAGNAAYMGDPSAFEDPADPNGQRYLVYADGGYAECGHVSIAKLDQATSTTSENQKVQWANQGSIPNAGGCTPAFMEGPELGYFGGPGTDGNGKYFLYFAMKDNTSYTESIAYATADRVMGPYTYQGIIMSGQGGTGWTNQAAIVEWQGHYLFFYHNDPKAQEYPNRQVFLECVGIQNGKISSITRGKYTTLSACPKASAGTGGQPGGGGMGSTGGGGGISAGGGSGGRSSNTGGTASSAGGTGASGGNGNSGSGGSGDGSATGGTLAAGGALAGSGGSAASGTFGTGGNGATAGGAHSSGGRGSSAGGSTAGSGTGGASTTNGGASSNGNGGFGGAAGGARSVGGSSNTSGTSPGGAAPAEEPSSEGCGCRVARRTNDLAWSTTISLLVVGVAARGRRRRRYRMTPD